MLGFLLLISDEHDHPKILHIYNRYHDDMIRFAKSRLRGMGCRNFDAEDVVQESFIKIIKYIDSIDLDSDEKSVRSYILAIVSNKINDFISNHKFVENLDDYIDTIDDDDDFIGKLLIKERYDVVMRAIDQMDEIYKITFTYRYRKEMSVKEIADFMEIPEKTVKTRILRGRKILLSIVNEEECKNG